MSYLGNTFDSQSFVSQTDYFSGNASTTAFTLSRTVASSTQIQVTIENVPQNPSSAYTVSGNTITFTSAPPTGTNNIYVYYLSTLVSNVPLYVAGSTGQIQYNNAGTLAASSNLSFDGSTLAVTGPTTILKNGGTGATAGLMLNGGGASTTFNIDFGTPVSNRLWMRQAYSDGAGTIKFQYSSDGTMASPIDVLTVNWGTGIAVTGLTDISAATSGQIKFPATQNASSNANTLDDYEEGTWTPAMTQSGATFTYSYQTGRYTKIGNVVTIIATLGWSAKSGGSGNVGYSGLPFPSLNVSGTYQMITCGEFSGFTLPTGATTLDGEILTNATTGTFYGSGSAVSPAAITTLASAGLLFLQCTYLSN